MVNMNRKMQRRMIDDSLERIGWDPDLVDVESLIDSSLSLPENLKNVEAYIGRSLYVGDQPDKIDASMYGEAPDWTVIPVAPDEIPDETATSTTDAPAEASDDPRHAPVPVDEQVVAVAAKPPPAPATVTPRPPPALSATDRDMIRRKTRLCIADNLETRHAVERVLAWEDAADPAHLKLGWEPGEVPVPGHAIRKFNEWGIIRTSYKSNRYTQYLLLDREASRLALTEVEVPIEARSAQETLDIVNPQVSGKVREILESGDALEALLPYVANHITGLENIKKALLLVLASPYDGGTSRGRLHALLHGPPGTAKSEFLLWLGRVSKSEVFSPRMSGAGLTVDMRTGEPGVLPSAHQSEFRMVLVDEVEKVEPRHIRQTLQALEEGQFTFTSANGTGIFAAEVRFAGAANKIENLPPEFVDRMDFKLECPLPTKATAKVIVRNITDNFMRPGGGPANEDVVRAYMRTIRTFVPEFSDAERALAGNLLDMLIDLSSDEKVRVRPYEGILRVAYALGRLNRRPVTADTVLEAIAILHPHMAGGKIAAMRGYLAHKRGAK